MPGRGFFLGFSPFLLEIPALLVAVLSLGSSLLEDAPWLFVQEAPFGLLVLEETLGHDVDLRPYWHLEHPYSFLNYS